jgi:hypothetical protein
MLNALINATLSAGALAIVPTHGNIAPIELPNATSASGALGPMSDTQGIDPAVTALLNGTLPAGAEEFGVGGAPPKPTTSGVAPEGIQGVCGDDQTATRLQAGGEFWIAQAASGAPVQFPPGVSTASSLGNAFSPSGNPTDPTLGPSGDRSNLPAPGPAGAWCRPLPVPFALSSPLASRAVLIPVVVLLVGVIVFWLSRGVKMPTRHAQSIDRPR